MAEFTDSVEATDAMHKISELVQDPRLVDWAIETDINYSVQSLSKLRRTQAAFKEFLNEIESADE